MLILSLETLFNNDKEGDLFGVGATSEDSLTSLEDELITDSGVIFRFREDRPSS